METPTKPLNHARYIYTILILLAGIILCLSFKSCMGEYKNTDAPQQKVVSSKKEIKLIYQKKWYPLIVKINTPKDSVSYPVPAKVDTLAILRLFFTEYTYRDTIQDTNLVAMSTIKIAENKIKAHKFSYKWLQPQKETIITNVIEKPIKPLFLIGLNVNINKNLLLGGGPEFLFISKRQRAIGMGYDPFHNTYSLKAYLPIRFK